jgi:hypothetical protein
MKSVFRAATVAARGFLVALAGALAGVGCVSTADQPFPLDGGEAAAIKLGDYRCKTFESGGRASTAAARLDRLPGAGKPQYAFRAGDGPSLSPIALRPVAGGAYLAAAAHSGDAGEDVALVRLAERGAAFTILAIDEGATERAAALAIERGAVFRGSAFGDEMSGPVEAQRAFLIDLAAEPTLWRTTAECRAGASRRAR